MGILAVDLNINKFYQLSFNRDECQTFIHVIRQDCRNRLKQRKVFKKCISKKIMPVAWIQKIGGIGTCQKIRKKGVESRFTDKPCDQI